MLYLSSNLTIVFGFLYYLKYIYSIRNNISNNKLTIKLRALCFFLGTLLLCLSYIKQMFNDLDETKDIYQRYLKMGGFSFLILYILFFMMYSNKNIFISISCLITYSILLYIIYAKCSHTINMFGIILFILLNILLYKTPIESAYNKTGTLLLIIGFSLYLYIEYTKTNEDKAN